MRFIAKKLSLIILLVVSFLSFPQYVYSADFDGDGIEDSIDLDDDNDGILDTIEGCYPTLKINEFGFNEKLLVLAYHGVIAKTINGYSVWGGSSNADGSTDQLIPTPITPENNYSYRGEIVDVTTAASGDTNSDQYFILTTEGLYVWGVRIKAGVYRTSLNDGMYPIDTDAFQEIPLPSGVEASDIRNIEATTENIALLTNSGEVWIAGYNFKLYGDGSTNRDNEWHHVKKANGEFLSDVRQIKLAPANAAALGEDRVLYVWGEGVTLGDGSGVQAVEYPTAMTMPDYQGAHLVQFEITARSRTHIDAGGGYNRQAAYFILDSSGKVHVLGTNTAMILGINNTNTSFHQSTWTYLRDEDGTSPITDVRFISLAHHSAYTLSGALLKADGTLLEWGSNDEEKIGGYGEDFVPKPSLPKGFERGKDMAVYVAVGGHLTPYYGKDGVYYNVGHNAEGGFGDGTTTSRDAYEGHTLAALDIVAGVLGINDFDGDLQPNCRDLDSDNDGIYDIVEAGNQNKDSNGDGKTDNLVGANGFDNTLESDDSANAKANYTPLNSDSKAGADYLDIDSDDDGIVDNIEAQPTFEYRAPSYKDIDKNGVDDEYDTHKKAIIPVDTDGDKIPDYKDLDSDNDGKNDALEGWDSNGDKVADIVAINEDKDSDGLDDGYDKNPARVNPTNDTTPESYPDVDNPGNDRDWREAFYKLQEIVAKNDSKVAQAGEIVTIDILQNDILGEESRETIVIALNPTSVQGIGEDRDKDGTIDKVVVKGEGVWELDKSGEVTFTPEQGFIGDTTPIEYTITGTKSGLSATATVTIHYQSTIAIEGFVWYDENVDGLKNKEEANVVDVEVKLYDANKNLLATTKTDKNGYYKFDIVVPNKEYIVAFTIPKSYMVTKRSKDNNVDSSGIAHIVTKSSGTNRVLMGITCSCNEAKVDPNSARDLDANAFNLLSFVMLFGLISLLGARRKEC